MADTPDFDQIARRLVESFDPTAEPFVEDARVPIAEQLRLVWNARGAADIAKVESVLYMESSAPYVKTIDRALRSLDVS